MFEEKTFENILSDMLSYVAERNSELDTREGSIIYTALAPIAIELETAYHEMDMILEETFLETASKEYLVKHGDQIGMAINEATFGHFEGEFNVDVEIGSRFNLDKFNYNVIDKLSDPTNDNPYYRFELVCETEGSEPNSYLGTLTPITYIGGLSYAELKSVIVYGEDEEDTEAYRYRLQIHLQNPPTGGNIAQYNEWLDECAGVGKYRVLPCWNGVNTVKLVILSSENTSADEELVNDIQEYFDPPTSTITDDVSDPTYPQGRGMGNGKALIGTIVTVGTVSEVPVAITCKLKLKPGYNTPVGIEEAIKDYLDSIALSKNSVSYMQIYAAIYNAPCVADIETLKITIDGKVMDSSVTPFIDTVTIGDDEIAKLDTENSVWSV